jgi:hypothetical protein
MNERYVDAVRVGRDLEIRRKHEYLSMMLRQPLSAADNS